MELNGRLQYADKNNKKRKKNITMDEEIGLKWLLKETKDGRLAVVKADKGGAILIVYPTLLIEKVQEKLNDPSLYDKLQKDPTKELHDELFDLWVKGKERRYVTDVEAKKVMGVTAKNNKSTSSHVKPGTTYFYPMLKIHKLAKENIKPGCNPPARLVTALQDGISKRSDVYLADRYLKELEKDFCLDLLKDTNSALRWLDQAEKQIPKDEKKLLKSFTFDFRSLYDSLAPYLVREALQYAMDTCRNDWEAEKKNWVLNLVDLSLRSSIGEFQGCWFRQKNGIPTGGSLCVELANITVYYIMNKTVYNNPELMMNIKLVKRYIDDGGGFFKRSQSKPGLWENRGQRPGAQNPSRTCSSGSSGGAY